jgi:hypothetical protein
VEKDAVDLFIGKKACGKISDPYNAAPSTGNNVNNITK